MRWHDAKKNPPKVTGDYMAVHVYSVTMCVMSYHYDADMKGWNIGIGTYQDSREFEQFPDYWGKMPTREELEGGES